MRRLAIPCAIVLALSVPALGQDAGERGYSNAVLAGRTETGEDVVLIAGRHQGFPFGGIDWDNVLLKVGSKAYRFTEIDPDDDRTLYMNVGVTGGPQGRPPDATISFAGTMEAFDVAAGVPKRAGSTPVALSVTTRIDPLAPKPVLEWVRRLDRKTPLMILDVFRMHDGEWSMDVGGVVHKIAPATVSGHIETTRNSSLNGSVNQPAYLLYDYAAGARPNDAGRSPAWTNGRLVTPFGGAPISVPLSVSGSLQPILSRRTLLTSRVPLGPFILERRLVTFRTPSENRDVYQGLKEVWLWRGRPLERGSAQRAVPNSPGVKAHGETETASLGGRFITVGGINNRGALKHVDAYDPLTDEWAELAPLPAARHHTAAISPAPGRLFVLGGTSGFIPPWKPEKTVFVYSSATAGWTEGPEMPEPRYGHDVLRLNGRLYVVGGHGENDGQSAVLIYTIATKAWSKGAPMPTPRHHVAAFILDGRIHVVGGRNEKTSLRTVEIYDPQSDTWSSAPDFPVDLNGASALPLRGKVYVFGGESARFPGIVNGDLVRGEVNGAIYVLDPSARTWSKWGEMLIPRHGMGAVSLGGRAYLLFGTKGAGALSAWTSSTAVETFRP